MSTYKDDNENNGRDTDACYQVVASQEEIYLEETEEEVRVVLSSETPAQNNDHRAAESFDELLADAAEELISGDADDPPLSQQAIAEMLNTSVAIHAFPRVL